jgi:cyclophilin family peptidyl-prolyl cis-trans isomerase/HEAT repeat protein
MIAISNILKFKHIFTLLLKDQSMANNNLLYLFIIMFCGGIFSCIPDTGDKSSHFELSLSDSEIQKIIDLGDKRDIKSLYSYLRHSNPSYRFQALQMFGSIKNAEANDSIYPLLSDPNLQIRAAAAYAIGQNGDPSSAIRLISAFRGKDTVEVNNIFNANILEAVGKVGNLDDLKALATVKTYRPSDSLLLLGQARAIFRMASRNIICDEGTSRMVDILQSELIADDVRIYAAHYLSRSKDINLDMSKIRLTDIFNKERNPDVRGPLAIALGKSKDTIFVPVLKTAFIAETDYRVKANILRAMSNFPYHQIKDIIIPNLKNENLHLASTAANVIVTNGDIMDVPLYAQYDTVTVPWQVRSKMNAAVLAHSALFFTKSKTAFSERIKQNIKNASSGYEKVSYIEALSKDPFNYFQLIQLYQNESNNHPKMAAVEGLGNVLKNPLFFKAFGNGYGKIKSEILNVLGSAIASGDQGQIAVASGILKDPALQWREWVKDVTFMKDALAKLKLPADIESYNELNSCIAYMEGAEFKAEKPTYNHPVDWSVIQTIGDSSIAAVKTTKGIIRIKLYKNMAPGSVANFVNLINQKFFNDKSFHRVVPNFVIQTGCPRGDGYGSPDYSIRTEVPQISYSGEGYVGMASAGQDTESSQWFITHSATPHLEGNYTIFGKVVEGMEVVHNIQMGDKINEIILVNK